MVELPRPSQDAPFSDWIEFAVKSGYVLTPTYMAVSDTMGCILGVGLLAKYKGKQNLFDESERLYGTISLHRLLPEGFDFWFVAKQFDIGHWNSKDVIDYLRRNGL